MTWETADVFSICQCRLIYEYYFNRHWGFTIKLRYSDSVCATMEGSGIDTVVPVSFGGGLVWSYNDGGSNLNRKVNSVGEDVIINFGSKFKDNEKNYSIVVTPFRFNRGAFSLGFTCVC